MKADMMRLLLVGQDVLLFILPALLLARWQSREPFEWLRLKNGVNWRVALLAAALMIIAQPAINLLAYLNQQMTLPDCMSDIELWMKRMEDANMALTLQLLGDNTLWGVICNVIVVGFCAAFSEELLFRGAVQGVFAKYTGYGMAIWCSAVIFSLMHMQFYGFFPRMLMGALFGYVLVWSGSLWLPALMHFVNNSLVVLIYSCMRLYGMEPDSLESLGTASTLWLGLLSIVLTAWMIYLLRRSCMISSASSLTD